MDQDLVRYYHLRAQEYERIYQKPERQTDLRLLESILPPVFAGQHILEIACGTGYWTQRIAPQAASIHALDINIAVLEIARSKHYRNSKVDFELADLYTFCSQEPYQGLFGGFIWSHIPLEQMSGFLKQVSSLVLAQGKLVFLDNRFVAGSNHPIAHTDASGNTYQDRSLSDGSIHRVLKNFPTEAAIRQILEPYVRDVMLIQLEYYWMVIAEKAD